MLNNVGNFTKYAKMVASSSGVTAQKAKEDGVAL